MGRINYKDPETQANGRKMMIKTFGIAEKEAILIEADNPSIEWMRLIHALDRVFLSGGAGMAQFAFMNCPIECAQGLTGKQLLREPDGPERFCKAARQVATEAGEKDAQILRRF